MRTPAKIHFILFLINAIYAVNYIVAKEIIPSVIGPYAMMFFRALAGFLFFTVVHYLGHNERVEKKDLLKIFGCAIFGIATNGMLFLKGISLTLPINASLIMILVPVLVMIISYLFLNEKIGRNKILGCFIGLVGAYILITKLQPLQFSSATFRGDLFILMNATSFAIYLVMVRNLMKKYKPLTLARWLFTFGLCIVFPFTIPQLKELDFSVFQPSDFIAFTYILVFTTCTAYYLYNVALKEVTPTVASSYIFLQPLITAIIALALGKDHLSSYKIIGGVCIFVGVALVNFSRSKTRST